MPKINWKNLAKRPLPIWERPEWDQMTWEEKMAVYKRHKRYNAILGTIFLVCFFGTMAQVFWPYARNLASDVLKTISIVITVIMGICLYLGQFLMD